MPASPSDRNFVTALARGLDVLACFRSGSKLLGNQDIAQRCRLPKSTVSRLTHTLTALGYLIHVPESNKYRLGTATLGLGSAMLSQLDVRQIARPFMQQLASLVQAEVSLGARDRFSMVYVEHSRSPSGFYTSLDLGSRIPLATTAMGRAWLAASPAAEQRQALAYLQAHAPEQWQAAQAQLPQWPVAGPHPQPWVAESMGDWLPHVNAVALAFSPGGGLPLMVVSCGGPASHVTPEHLRRHAAPQLQQMMLRLEYALSTARPASSP